MTWFVIASLVILVVVVRTCFVTSVEMIQDDEEGYNEEYFRYSEHSENQTDASRK